MPPPSGFFHAILSVIAQNPDGLRRRDIFEPVADRVQLTFSQRAERLPSGRSLRYQHRIGWSLNMLKAAGYVESPSPGVWQITSGGQERILAQPLKFSEATIREINRASRAAVRGDSIEDASLEPILSASQQAPVERIDSAVKEIEEAVARELLERISQAPPQFFEQLVLDLLHALGYGKSEADLQHLGGSGDAGIDGVISLDKLGFEKVCIQAKRWQGSVGRPEIQGFFGALAGRRAKKGVFITTASFTKDARDFGQQVSENIVLIDGARLTSLMIEYGVGVTLYRTIRLPRVDGDYFE
ncbi:MAG TPA: restriction endonuclease [Thermoanaerobaculia bacterium]|nr:restriction endonuclease [Thermoanaerobaculia bacterium]